MTADPDPHRLRHLRGCHPELAYRVRALIDALAHEGHTILLTQGVRTAAQQAALYAQGRTRPGKVVTNCDGVTHRSNHQPKADGYGYAVDVAWRIRGLVTWEGPWDRLGTLAAAHGLTWGGTWVRFPDRPHLELPPGVGGTGTVVSSKA
jgi:peptidoglycan L-alanyl-D-glutamate endopeptidase CwlK